MSTTKKLETQLELDPAPVVKVSTEAKRIAERNEAIRRIAKDTGYSDTAVRHLANVCGMTEDDIRAIVEAKS